MSEFPTYSGRERLADAALHILAVGLAAFAAVWLAIVGVQRGSLLDACALLIYGIAMMAMWLASAAYNLLPAGGGKRLFRRIDHAMIFVMIAGSYTPFTLIALEPSLGRPFCAAAWAIALVGAGLKLAGRLGGRLSLACYLGLGWLLLPAIVPFQAALSGSSLLLLLAGGLLYSAGAVLHAQARLAFHNALWHACVLAGAALHFAAVAELLPRLHA